MNNQIANFENSIYENIFLNKKIKIYGTHEEPLFIARDIGEVLGIKDIKGTIKNFDDDEFLIMDNLHPSKSGNPNTLLLNEKGLYHILFTSRTEIAKIFRKFVYDVLHNLRTNKFEYAQAILKDKVLALENELNGYKQKIKDYEIYKITDRNNEKNKYIGITGRNLEKRVQEHFRLCFNTVSNQSTLLLNNMLSTYYINKNSVRITKFKQFYEDMKKFYEVTTIKQLKQCTLNESKLEEKNEICKNYANLNMLK